MKISSTKISYNIYIYNRYFRNNALSMFRESNKGKVGATFLATILINVFFLIFHVNIQPSCSKARMEYFNIKTRLSIRET